LYDSPKRLGPKPPFIPKPASQPLPKEITKSENVGTLRDAAINRIARDLEVSLLLQRPELIPVIEAVRWAYNHRDYLYDVCKELTSTRPAEEKIENLKDRTVDEIKAELVSLLTRGGIQAVSSQLRQLGFFDRPFGERAPPLDPRTSAVFQGFFESSVAEVIGMGASV